MTGVSACMRALLEGIVDYAGLFPPARLEMVPTVRNYATYLRGEDAWMLGRLIVPVSRLEEFELAAASLLPNEPETEPWQISALTAPAESGQLAADLFRIAEFNRVHADAEQGMAEINVIELTADAVGDIESALDLIDDGFFPYFEIPINKDPRGLIASLAGSDAGAKVRTGGMSPELYPAATDLARFICACATAEVPFKATAGLHHPLRHRNESVGATEFGFLNIFLAACIAHEGAAEPDVWAMLEEADADIFDFSDEEIRWREHTLAAEQIENARGSFAVSFGSCSFDEPREDLRQLGLL